MLLQFFLRSVFVIFFQDHGFDTGVMLLDLSRFRLVDWLSIYNSVVHRVLVIQQYRDFAEQVCLLFRWPTEFI